MAARKTIQIISGQAVSGGEKLLLKICRNKSEWLSPIGWKDYETSTLLPYSDLGGIVQVFFSNEYTSNMKASDTLTITSYELGLEETLSWETAKQANADITVKKPEKSSGLLSKLTGSSKPDSESISPLSQTERRVADAERATEDYKAKMEAATLAQVEATRRAQEAARQAEEALRLEAERAAEMERAARAFEEAERLKQEEMSRIEEERRLEEERLAEEARRIEAARQRQLAAKREAERQAALKRFTGALDVTHNENRDLQKRLSALQSKSANLAQEQQHKTAKISKLQETLQKTSETVETRFSTFEKKQASLDALAEEQAKLHTEADRLKGERQTLSLALTEAETEYKLAQKVVEEANARAEAKRVALEAKRRKDTEMLEFIGVTSEKLGHQSRLVSDASVKVQDVKAKLEAAQTKLSQAKLENETLEQEKQALEESVKVLNYDMEMAQASMEALERREQEYVRAIAHLEAGGSPDDVETALSISTTSISDSSEEIALEKSLHTALDPTPTEKASKPLTSKPAAKLSFPIHEASQKSSFLASVTSNMKQGFNSRNTFMTLAVLLGGAVIVGGSYVTYQSLNSQSLIVKNDVSTPEEVASAVTKVEPTEVDARITLPTTPETSDSSTPQYEASVKAIIQDAKLELEEPLSATPTKSTVAKTPTAEETKETVKKPVEVEVKTANTSATPIATPSVKPEPVIKTAELKIEEIKTAAPVLKAEPKSIETKPAAATNYPELTMDVQNKLSQLGFYYDAVDGQLSDSTNSAISEFKSLYDLPNNSDISGPFINQLNKAITEREEAIKMAAVTVTEPVAIEPLIETATVKDVVLSPITIAETIQPQGNITLEPVIEVETTKVVEAPTIVPETKPEAVPQDIIVEAELQNKLSSNYPRKAERNNIYINNVVVVEYDIGTDGKPANVKVIETEYDGRYASSFEEAAINTITRARYSPKTVNGQPVISESNTKRIVFRGE